MGGRAGEGSGPGAPLVLLHGWGAPSGVWSPLLPRLVDRFAVHCVDLPGHGKTRSIAPYSIAAVADDVAAAAAELTGGAASPPIVVGWSLGGLVALEWARARPGSLRALVLAASSPCFVQRADWPSAVPPATLAQFGDEFAASYRRTLLRFLSLQLQGSDDGRAALAQLRGRLFGSGDPTRATLDATRDLLATTDLRGSVPDIGVPTLVIGGERDTLVPSAALRWVARALPRGTLELIPGAAHAPFLSHPEAFVAALRRFCDAC
jgi:pimeloyl-[acyl-carrier protein] methyl ester esterase